jgi:hypothetical protein
MEKLSPTTTKGKITAFQVAIALLFSIVMAFVGGFTAFALHVQPLFGAIAGAGLSLIPTPSGVLGLKIGTLTTGAAAITTFDLQFVPEKLYFAAATQLTGLKVEVMGVGTIVDLDASGLTVQGLHRLSGRPTNGYIIDVADGIIKGTNCRVTMTNSAAQTPDVFAMGDNDGTIYIRTQKQYILASNATDIDNFAALFMPSLAAGDKIIVTFDDNTTQIFERDELAALSGYVQNTTAYQLDNLDGSIKNASLLVATAQTVYKTDYLQA